MSAAGLTHTCPVCGAEESLDALLVRMVDDDTTRRLLADVMTNSLAVGAQVVRYLRMHKPPKQKLRLERVRQVLAELVPAIRTGRIQRKGREWVIAETGWKAAFTAVFEAAEKGSLSLPLEGNGYLFEVAMRQADRTEAEAEREIEADRKHHRHAGDRPAAPTPVAAALDDTAARRTRPPESIGQALMNLKLAAIKAQPTAPTCADAQTTGG